MDKKEEEKEKKESVIMSIPRDSNLILIRNKYYTSGLTEGMIFTYYKERKDLILSEVKDRIVFFFLFVGENDYIIKRNYKGKNIILTKENYDFFVNGRTVSISMEQTRILDYIIIDIDSRIGNEKNIKICVKDIINFFEKIEMINDTRVITSANSFHVYGYLKRNNTFEVIKPFLEKKMKYYLDDKYDINKKNGNKEINLDFSPMYYRGSHPVPYSINRNGLMCLDVTDNWEKIKREDLIIHVS